ncbi:YlxR family protein [Thermodesulfobacteriota bacterium]
MGKGKGHTPLRTCISCRSKRAKIDLVRLMIDKEDRVVKDISGKMHGRGAYVCKTGFCREQLSRNSSIKRMFRTDKVITLSPELKIDLDM